jgi:hypothetical protein
MTAISKTKRAAWLGKRFAELAVVLLTVVALLAGWLLKTSVENRSQAFSSGNITAQIPAGWLQLAPRDNQVLHITDRTSQGFGMTYMIQEEAVPVDSQPGQIAGLWTMNSGSNLTAYRVLDQQEVLVQGQKATEIDYVYVESGANLIRAVIPVVVKGQDFIFVSGSQAVIVTYRAELSAFDAGLGRFYRFLVSVRY